MQVSQEFYKYTSPDDLVAGLKLSLKLSTMIYNYWKLKRRVCVVVMYDFETLPKFLQSLHNRTMLTDLPIESSLESIRAEVDWARKVFLTLMTLSLTQTLVTQNGASDDEKFYTIVHLRQNFEKVWIVYLCVWYSWLLTTIGTKSGVYGTEKRKAEETVAAKGRGAFPFRKQRSAAGRWKTKASFRSCFLQAHSVHPMCIFYGCTNFFFRSKAPDHHGGGADCISPPTNCALSNHTAELPTRTLRTRDYHSYDVACPQVGTKRKLSERELNSPPVSDSEMMEEHAHNLRHRLPQIIS